MASARHAFGDFLRLGQILVLGLAAAFIAMALPVTGRAAGSSCEWLAGDFHVHTVYSHDAYGGPDDPGTGIDEFYTLGWTPGQQGAIAESRGLDFIAITDHNNVDGYAARDSAASGVAFYESGWGRADQIPGGDPLVWVPNYENSVSGAGHAQMHGATQVYDRSLRAPEAAAAIRADGGAFQINHPSDMDWHDDAGNYEYPGFAPDALEVWNIGVWLYEPPFPATNDHEFPVTMYDGFLDQGFRVAATGGSDNHWRATTAAQGVGQPTTWVCAEGRTSDAIVAAVKSNRTSVSHQPPAYGGSRAYLYADDDGDGTFEAMVGDTVQPGSRVEAVVENAVGATLRLVTNGGRVLVEETVTSPAFSNAYDVPLESTWVRAEVFYPDGRDARRELQPLCDLSNQFFGEERDSRNTYCENRLAMLAMTSPIYFKAESFDPATSLLYTGDTQRRVGSNATLSAILTDSSGAPLPAQPITFTFGKESLEATTDGSGRAEVTTRVPGPPGNYLVHVNFVGSDTYDPAHEEVAFKVTPGK
jgi:hypothetical protein